MSESFWFKHDIDTFNLQEHKMLRLKHGIKGYGLYWYILEILANNEDHCLTKSQFVLDAMAIDTLEEPEKILAYIDDAIIVGLLDGYEDVFWSEELNDRLKLLDEIRSKRVEAGRLGAEARWKEKEKPKKTTFKEFPPTSDEYKLSYYLAQKIKENSPSARIPSSSFAWQQWANNMDKLLRIDRRPVEEVYKVIDYAIGDSFWQANILSVVSLRKHYDKLLLKVNRTPRIVPVKSAAHQVLE